MQPYHTNGNIAIYHGDCLDVLKAVAPSPSVIVTDPPFYLPARISTSRREWPRSLSEVAVMESYFRGAFKAIVGRLRRDGAFYTFCDGTSAIVFGSILYPLFARTHTLVWDKAAGGMGNGWRHSTEFLIHGAHADTAYAPGFRRDLLTFKTVPSADRAHASEKPVPLIEALLSAHPAGPVLDPFMGSGATLRAAQSLGYPAIGIDVEESNCEAAAKRRSEPRLFGAA